MTALAAHIDNAVKAGRIRNRADIARALAVSQAAVSRWCSGARTPSAEEASAMARLIGMPEELLMAECEAERAKDEETRDAWLRVARFCRPAKNTAALIVSRPLRAVGCCPLRQPTPRGCCATPAN